MSAQAILSDVVAALESAGAPYMLVGSVASSYHAAPRSTQDIDLVVGSDADALRQFIAGIDRTKYYVDENAAREAAAGTQFNVIDPSTGWKVDVLVSRDRPFSRCELGRRMRVEILGVTTYVATPEDTILTKLEWAADRPSVQLEDVTRLLVVLGDALDHTYLDRWAAELGVQGHLDAARRDAAVP